MKPLHNIINKKELDLILQESKEERITISFYKYFQIPDPDTYRDELYKVWSEIGVYGRTYVAAEGINAQISIPKERWEDFTDQINEDPDLHGIRLNVAVEDDGKSFAHLKIKHRPKILADGIEDPGFDPSDTGRHLDAVEFNELTDKENTVLIDMRNHYETEVGHFENAITPDVDTFKESLPIIADMLEDQKDKDVVMYCTGGIRCEKASAYLKFKGFEKVYQLNGGIINYKHQVDEQDLRNKFIGKNFVFDKRMGERITDDVISVCHQCGEPADTHVNCANLACHVLFIQCPSCQEKMEVCCSEECQEIIHLPEEEQIKMRKLNAKGRRVYKKGRSEKLKFKK